MRLISLYLNKEATNEQLRMLEDWCNVQPDNRQQLRDCERLWKHKKAAPMPNFDSSAAFRAFKAKMMD